jgi:hypothetical protein
MTGYINVMLVLQSSSDSLHIPPGSCSETNATSDGVCNFSNIEVEENIDVIEEVFISINEEVDRGIKEEAIAGDITFPEIKPEPEEVSCVCYWTHFTSVQESLLFFVLLQFLAS